MNKLEFIRKLDASSEHVTNSTAEIWWHILSWFSMHEYADTADSPNFVQYVQGFRSVTVSTLNRHLTRMAGAGFLQAHAVRRKLPTEVKADLNSSMHALLFGGGAVSMPTGFKRFTLPGKSCSLELKAVERAHDNEEAFHKHVM